MAGKNPTEARDKENFSTEDFFPPGRELVEMSNATREERPLCLFTFALIRITNSRLRKVIVVATSAFQNKNENTEQVTRVTNMCQVDVEFIEHGCRTNRLSRSRCMFRIFSVVYQL